MASADNGIPRHVVAQDYALNNIGASDGMSLHGRYERVEHDMTSEGILRAKYTVDEISKEFD